MRELRNLVERLTILGPGRIIAPEDLPPEMRSPPRPAGAEGHATPGRSIGHELAETERLLVEKALREADGHRGRAAEILGISRHALKRRLQRLGFP